MSKKDQKPIKRKLNSAPLSGPKSEGFLPFLFTQIFSALAISFLALSTFLIIEKLSPHQTKKEPQPIALSSPQLQVLGEETQIPLSPPFSKGETNSDSPSFAKEGWGGFSVVNLKKELLSTCHNCIQGKHIQDSAIDSSEIENKSILSSDIKTGQINSRLIENHSIQSIDLDPNQTFSKLTLDQLTIGQGSPSHFTLDTGDAYITDNLEVDGNVYLDQTLYVRDSSSISTMTSNTLQTTTANISNILSNSHLQIKGRLPNEDYFQINDFLKVFINPSQGTYIGANYTTIPTFSHIDGQNDLYIQDDLEVNGTIYGTISGAFSPSGNLDMDSNLILNIGHTNTDFTTGGGLNLAGNLGLGTTNPATIFHINQPSDSNGLRLTRAGGTTGLYASFEIVNGATTPYLNISAQDDSTSRNIIFAASGGSNIGIGSTSPGAKLQVIGANDLNTSFAAKIGGATTTGLVITNNGNVGIGTTGPSAKLEVNTGAIGNFAKFRGAGDERLTINQQAENDWRFYIYDDTEAAYKNLGLGGSAGGAVTITTSGNVGIGTTSPTALLHIGSQSNTTTELTINSEYQGAGFTGSSVLNFAAGSFNRWRQRTIQKAAGSYSFDLVFEQLSNTTGPVYTERMRINESGNLGIGTTGPANPLDVRGVVSIGATSGASTVLKSNIADSGQSASITLRDLTTGAIIFQPGSTYNSVFASGNVGIGLTAPGEKLSVAGNVMIGDSTWSAGTTTGDLAIQGNVGIGTAGPTALLHVQSAVTSDVLARIRSLSTEQDARIFIGEADTYGMTFEYDGVANIGYIGMNDAVDPTGAWSKRIQMSRSGTEVAFMAGNVGIGTTAPGDKLEVNGGVRISGTSYYVSGQARLYNNDGLFLSSSTGSVNDFYLTNSAGSTVLKVPTGTVNAIFNGNVGIGTTGPAGKLTVLGASTATADSYNPIFAIDSNATNAILFGTLSGSPFGTYIQSGDLAGTGTYPLLLNPNGGNVGIGTTTPDALLTVNGTTRIMSKSPTVPTSGTSLELYYASGVFSDTPAAQLISYDRTNSAYKPMVFDASRFNFNTGNVGIGTTGPGSKLSVSGGATFGSTYSATAMTDGNIAISGNVGIGLTAPGEKLSVAGNVMIGDSTWSAGTTTGDLAIQGNVGIGETAPGSKLSVSGGGSFGASYDTTAAPTNGLIIEGNVGIGTTTPGSDLHVVGTGYFTGRLGIIRSDASYGEIVLGNNINTTRTALILNNESGSEGGVLAYHGSASGPSWGSHQASRLVLMSTSASSTGMTLGTIAGDIRFNTGAYSSANIRMVIDTSGNVGIGTTGPGAKLDVRGDAWLGIMSSYNTEGSLRLGRADGVSRYHLIKANNFDSSAPVNNYITFAISNGTLDSTTDVLSLKGNGNVIINNGNIGIGTTSPGAKLSVYKGASGATAFAESNFILEDSNTNILQFLSPNTDVNGIMFGDPENTNAGYIRYSHSDDSMRLYTAGTEKLTISTAGNLGIGTTSPGAKLDTNGMIRSIGQNIPTSGAGAEIFYNGSMGYFSTYDRGAGSYLPTGILGSSIGFYPGGGATAKVSMLSTGNVGIGLTAPGEKLSVAGNVMIGDSTWSAGTTTGDLAIQGNVGIGTTGPGSLFTVAGTIRSDTSGTPEVYLNKIGTRGWSIRNDGAFNIYNWETATNQLTVLNSGNVGIGTTSPVQKLHLYGGSIKVSRYSGANAVTDILIGSTVSDTWPDDVAKLQVWRDGSLGQGWNFITNTNAGDENQALRIEPNGNIGIGTTGPGSKLEVYDTTSGAYNAPNILFGGTGNKVVSINSGAGSTALLTFNDGGTTKWGLSKNADNSFGIYDYAGSAERLTIKNGNVGIGTTSPTQKLAVTTSDVATYNPALKLQSSADHSSVITGVVGMQFNPNNNDALKSYIGAYDARATVAGTYRSGLIFATQEGITGGLSGGVFERMRIDNTGNVGIGTTEPGKKLTILPSSAGDGVYVRESDNGNDAIALRGYGATGQLQIFNGGVATVSIAGDSSVSFINGGNVGIGTTAPSYPLHIISNTVVNLRLQNTSNTGYVGTTLADDTGAHVSSFAHSNSGASTLPSSTWLGSVAAEPLHFITNTVTYGYIPRMTIDATGNVGIGTTAPAFKFEVVSTAAGNVGHFVAPSPAITGGTINLKGSEVTGAIDTGAGVLFTGYDGVTGRSWAGVQGLKENSTSGNYAGYLRFNTRPNGGAQTERMRITSDGNVGIGTTGPSAKLHVVGDTYVTGDVSALTFTDRTPYPENLTVAYNSVLSMQKLPEGEYDPNNKEQQLDHSLLSPFIQSQGGYRDLSASVSSINEVTKYLLNQVGGLHEDYTLQGTVQTISLDITNNWIPAFAGMTSEVASVATNLTATSGEIADLNEKIDLKADQSDLSDLTVSVAQLATDYTSLELRIISLETAPEYSLPEEFQTLQEALAGAKIEFDAEGNLKVKKLETDRLKVNGEEDRPECLLENEGEIFYDKTDKHFYGCNGEVWEELNSPALKETPETP